MASRFVSRSIVRATTTRVPHVWRATSVMMQPTPFSVRCFSEEVRKKTPEQLISEVPVIEIDGDLAICDGSAPGEPIGSGHPVEYINLAKSRPGEPETCKYCGLRYIQTSHH